MASRIQVNGTENDVTREILTPGCLEFVAGLTERFVPAVEELRRARVARRSEIDAGAVPDFLPETEHVRNGDWKVGPVPDDLADRRVEITGPTDRKMIINALNSGANVFMADCEDSLSPTWDNVIHGQVNLRDAVNRSISLDANGKHYALAKETATLIVRPRGWHLDEKHLEFGGKPVPAALVDFALYLFHNAGPLRSAGTGPYFYLPKLESHREARLWCEIFRFAEDAGIVEPGEIKVTVLIETILAAFEMDEILYELRGYIIGLNCGRWDYIFSFIKTFSQRADCVLPDRSEITMTRHFLRSYSKLLIQTCHRRGAYAIGGMAAQIPIKGDEDGNRRAIRKVRIDKEREVSDGHDGTWVAHPGLVPIARAVFDEHMQGTHQVGRHSEDIEVSGADLLQVPRGKITEAGLRANINVAVRYIASWMDGNGCVPINNLMEDAATAEISRAQVWQWVHHDTGILDTGKNITYAYVKALLREEMDEIRTSVGDEQFGAGKYRTAANLLDKLTRQQTLEPFLTSVAYPDLP